MGHKKHRIAYLLTPVEFGGAEKVSLNFLQNVDRELFEIHPIFLFRPWERDTFFLKEIKKASFSVYMIPVSFGKKDHLWLMRCFRKLYSFLRQGQFDLLHTHGYFADIIGITTANILRIPTISTCHGFIENDRKLSLYNHLDRIVLRLSDRIIAVSTDIQKGLIRRGIRASRIKLIPNAVQTDIEEASLTRHRQETRQRFDLSEKDFVLGYVGRLSPEKGLTYLIEATSLARIAGYPIKLLIIGEGPQQAELRDLVIKWELESCVIFTGFQNNVNNLLPAIDIFILPSLTEGTPMALLEAMAYGIAAIASAVGQVPELIDSGKSGVLVTPGDAQQIRDHIVFLHDNPSMRKSISKRAQRKIRDQFDIKAWVKRIETEYINVIKSHMSS